MFDADAKKKTGQTMQELTDEKRKELDEKVENGGKESIKIRTNQILPSSIKLCAEKAISARKGLAAFVVANQQKLIFESEIALRYWTNACRARCRRWKR